MKHVSVHVKLEINLVQYNKCPLHNIILNKITLISVERFC